MERLIDEDFSSDRGYQQDNFGGIYAHSAPGGGKKAATEYANIDDGRFSDGGATENSATKRPTVNIMGYVFDYDLLVAKGFYFFFYAAFGSLFPLIAIYFKQLGMNPTQAGFLIENFEPDPSNLFYGTPGKAPDFITTARVSNYDPDELGVLLRPQHSYRIYRQSVVEEVFLLLLLLIILGEFFSAPAMSLADACTMSLLEGQPELYGKQRMFGSIGWGLAMFFVGIALDNSNSFPDNPCSRLSLQEKNYTLCFAVFSVLMTCALITSTQFRFPEAAERPDLVPQMIMDSQTQKVDPAKAENVRARAPEPVESITGPRWFGVLKTFGSPHYVAFLVVAWWMGFGIGLVFAFLFWHLQDIGGSPTLFGMASVINHISEVLAYFFTFRLINRFGHIKVLYLGLFANFWRFLYVSYIPDPYWVLPFEFVQGISHAAVWAAATSYITLAAPPSQRSTAQGILQGLHHGIGRGLGALIGGIFISYTGTPVAFRTYSVICLLVLGGSYLINKFFKAEGIKYQTGDFENDGAGAGALAPHGIPMHVAGDEKLTDKFIGNYGAMEPEPAPDPTQEAYDRYITQPYEKQPVRFEQIPAGFGMGSFLNYVTQSLRQKGNYSCLFGLGALLRPAVQPRQDLNNFNLLTDLRPSASHVSTKLTKGVT